MDWIFWVDDDVDRAKTVFGTHWPYLYINSSHHAPYFIITLAVSPNMPNEVLSIDASSPNLPANNKESLVR